MTKHHRFLLFAGECYYAKGGLNDLFCSSNDVESAVMVGEDLLKDQSREFEWYHVWDSQDRVLVAKSENQAYGADDDMKEFE